MAETRKIAAILAADVVGFSRMASTDEDRTLARLRALRIDLIDPAVASQNGRVFKRTGDGALIEFRSVVEAVRCAISVQNAMAERNAATPEAQRIVYRIGINLGDILIDGDDILGDGVNVAARIEGLCEPGGVLISASAYDQVRGKIDAAFVDLGPKAMKNIAEPVRVFAVGPNGATKFLVMPATSPKGPARLSIVVLPFANLGGGAEHEDFVDGVTESLTTDLSRIRGSFVIARNTAFTFKGKAVDVKQIGRELNVRYVLEGSVQRGDNRLRVNVQLIDSETGHHLWAERFDKFLVDLFDMQDEIVARLASALSVELTTAEARRAERVAKPDSIDLYFQGLSLLNKSITRENVTQAREFLDRTLAADPDNVEALVASARADLVAGGNLFVSNPMAAFTAAEMKLTKALSRVPDHAVGHVMLGALFIHSRRVGRGIAECEHGLALGRNIAIAHAFIGLGKIQIGRAQETEAHIVEALRLSPRDAFAYLWMSFAGQAKSVLGLHDEALAWVLRSIEANRNYALTHFGLASTLVFLGRHDEARSAVTAGLALDPTFAISLARAGTSALSDDPVVLAWASRTLEALRMAGVPEQ